MRVCSQTLIWTMFFRLGLAVALLGLCSTAAFAQPGGDDEAERPEESGAAEAGEAPRATAKTRRKGKRRGVSGIGVTLFGGSDSFFFGSSGVMETPK